LVTCRRSTFTHAASRRLTLTVTSALIGASRPEHVADAVAALKNADFTTDELAEIDGYAVDSGVNLWAASAERA
jgi:L-glyceraldehyde 3-phosphate reductase